MPVTALPDLALGWELLDTGGDVSPLLDHVPFDPDPARLRAAYERWRHDVEQDQHRRTAAGTGWYAFTRPPGQPVLCCFGGTPRTWHDVLFAMCHSLQAQGVRVRIADLSRSGALDHFHRSAAHPGARWRTLIATVGEGRSDVDPLATTSPDERLDLVIEVGRRTHDRSGMIEARADRAALAAVASRLTGDLTLARLASAVELALTGVRSGTDLGGAEEMALTDYHHVSVARRPALGQSLDAVLRSLADLQRWVPAPGRQPVQVGRGEELVATLQPDPSTSALSYEIATDLVARFVARTFERPSGSRRVVQVVLGAEALPPDVAQSLESAASRMQQQLVLFFGRLRGPGEDRLGALGGRAAVFFTLPNHHDAEIAASYVGREYTFVINGNSFAQGQTHEYSTGTSSSTDRSTSRARSFGRSFSATVTRGLSQSSGSSTTTGQGTSSTSTTTTARVHEYVIEPEQFQRLPDSVAVAVVDRQAVVVHCEPAIRKLPHTRNDEWIVR